MSSPIGTVTELWRYPVKSMGGERVQALELDALGAAGDRRFAITSSGAPRGKPLLTGAERAAMLLFHASGGGAETQVTTPAGNRFNVHDPRLMEAIASALPGGHALLLAESQKPLTDVRPLALLSTGTMHQLSQEMGGEIDRRRFRANLLLHMADGFAEDSLAGQLVSIGSAVLRVTERIPRCRIVTLDPETSAADPALMKHLDRHHGGCVGVYAVAVTPGTVRVGDAVGSSVQVRHPERSEGSLR